MIAIIYIKVIRHVRIVTTFLSAWWNFKKSLPFTRDRRGESTGKLDAISQVREEHTVQESKHRFKDIISPDCAVCKHLKGFREKKVLPLTWVSYSATISLSFRNFAGDVMAEFGDQPLVLAVKSIFS